MVYNWEIYFPPHVRIALDLLVDYEFEISLSFAFCVSFVPILLRIQLTQSQNGFQCEGDLYPVNAWNYIRENQKMKKFRAKPNLQLTFHLFFSLPWAALPSLFWVFVKKKTNFGFWLKKWEIRRYWKQSQCSNRSKCKMEIETAKWLSIALQRSRDWEEDYVCVCFFEVHIPLKQQNAAISL